MCSSWKKRVAFSIPIAIHTVAYTSAVIQSEAITVRLTISDGFSPLWGFRIWW